MTKSLICWLWGHSFWEWIRTGVSPGGRDIYSRVEYDRCLRCDKQREPQGDGNG